MNQQADMRIFIEKSLKEGASISNILHSFQGASTATAAALNVVGPLITALEESLKEELVSTKGLQTRQRIREAIIETAFKAENLSMSGIFPPPPPFNLGMMPQPINAPVRGFNHFNPGPFDVRQSYPPGNKVTLESFFSHLSANITSLDGSYSYSCDGRALPMSLGVLRLSERQSAEWLAQLAGINVDDISDAYINLLKENTKYHAVSDRPSIDFKSPLKEKPDSMKLAMAMCALGHCGLSHGFDADLTKELANIICSWIKPKEGYDLGDFFYAGNSKPVTKVRHGLYEIDSRLFMLYSDVVSGKAHFITKAINFYLDMDSNTRLKVAENIDRVAVQRCGIPAGDTVSVVFEDCFKQRLDSTLLLKLLLILSHMTRDASITKEELTKNHDRVVWFILNLPV